MANLLELLLVDEIYLVTGGRWRPRFCTATSTASGHDHDVVDGMTRSLVTTVRFNCTHCCPRPASTIIIEHPKCPQMDVRVAGHASCSSAHRTSFVIKQALDRCPSLEIDRPTSYGPQTVLPSN